VRWPSRLASVRLRITLLATVALAAGLAVGASLLVGSLRNALLDAQSGTGQRRAAELAALAGRGPLPAELPAVDAGRLTLLQVIDLNGRVVAASAQLRGVPALTSPTRRRREVRDELDNLGDGPWLLEPTPATLGGRPAVVIVITSLTDYERSAELLRGSLLVSLPILILIVAGVVWLVVGRALRPVEAMRSEVEHITSERLDRRVPAPGAGDEIGKLAKTLNDMLDRLEESSSVQRRFVADASHELRTPIANIRVAMEVASAHPELANWVAVADDVLAQDARMERMTDDLLLLARTGEIAVPLRLGPVNLAELVTAQLSREIPGDRRLVTSDVADVTITGDREQLARMLSNLIDNALRHARRQVTIGVAAGASSVEIKVSDDGSGIDRADRDVVFDPFVRLDQHRDRHQGGAGLGLAIVRQVVLAHHGTIRITDNDPGAVFVVRLPLSGSSQAPSHTVQT
jgi:signal transduction histidine kinase